MAFTCLDGKLRKSDLLDGAEQRPGLLRQGVHVLPGGGAGGQLLLELAQAVQREGEEKRRAQQPTSKEAPDKKPSILAKLKAQPTADTPSLKSAPKRSAEREL